jgi:hypothetical protein
MLSVESDLMSLRADNKYAKLSGQIDRLCFRVSDVPSLAMYQSLDE